MSFAGYFLSVLFCLLSMLISDSRFDLVWFRLSCDHGWIRSGSVNVRKQQQQQQSAMVRCMCTSRDSVLCARALLLHAVLSDELHFRNPREVF